MTFEVKPPLFDIHKVRIELPMLCHRILLIGVLSLFPISSYACGDVNSNGKINVGDASLALRATIGIEYLDVIQVGEADVNADGSVDVADAIAILRYIVGIGTTPPCLITDSYADDEKVIANWSTRLQYINTDELALYSFGAIRVNSTVGAYDAKGTIYYLVVPYFSNLFVLNLLHTNLPNRLKIAEDWITWYLSHINPKSGPEGVPYDHFYNEDGHCGSDCIEDKGDQSTFCCHVDATDSSAATFFSLLWAYFQVSKNSEFLKEPNRKEKIITLAGTLKSLLDRKDGLFWTNNTHQKKLLMDNCEVFAGFQALSQLEVNVYEDSTQAIDFASIAEGALRIQHESKERESLE
jgi:hypothetical protein